MISFWPSRERQRPEKCTPLTPVADAPGSLLLSIVCLAMMVGLVLSPNLWLTERSYPLVPVVNWLPVIPPPEDSFVYFVLIVLAAFGIGSRIVLKAFVVLLLVVALGDQTRWQPWVYQYFWMLFALGFCNRHSAINACRFIMIATYIWSGAQKYNFTFANDTFVWVTSPLVELAPQGWQSVLKSQGWTVAIVESAIGVLLLIPRIRVVGVVLAVLMHAVLLYCLGPWGHNWNEIVWPWNIAMIAFNLVLFAKNRPVSAVQILTPCRSTAVIVLLFGIMPLASFSGSWDSYLSMSLYSGNTIQSRVILSEDVLAKLPPEVSTVGNEINLSTWAMLELGVPAYPARRVSEGVANKLRPVTLVIDERPNWRTGERIVTRLTLR